MKEKPVQNVQRMQRGILLLGLLAGIAAIAGFSPWHWWKRANAVDILQLAEKTGGSRVSIEGDVTYYDVPHATAVLEDDTSAIAITAPAGTPIKVGQRIRVDGTLPKDYDPTAPVAVALDIGTQSSELRGG